MMYLGTTLIDETNFFFNKKVVLTGTLTKFGRKEATNLLEDFGAHCSSAVSKATDLVIVGDNPGSKYDKAHSNVEIQGNRRGLHKG